jgi:glutathione S-transferase
VTEVFTHGSTNGHQVTGLTFDSHPNLEAWLGRVGARPAVARGVTTPSGLPNFPPRKRA